MSTCDLSFSLTSRIPIKEGQRLLIAPNWESSLKPGLGWLMCVAPFECGRVPRCATFDARLAGNRQTCSPCLVAAVPFTTWLLWAAWKIYSNAPISGRNARWKRDRITRKSCYKKRLCISSPKSSAGFWQFALLSPIKLMFFLGCTFWCEIFKV